MRPVGSSNTVAVAHVASTPVAFPLAPGDYGVTALDDSGRLVGASHATVAAGRTSRVTLAAQSPAEIRVEFRDRSRQWEVMAWRLAAGGSPVNSPWPGPGESQTVHAGVGEEAATLRANESGLYRVMVAPRDAVSALFRTIEVAGGDRVRLKVPAQNASLSGIRPEPGPGTGRKGVQLWLRSADTGGWDVENIHPELQSDGSFRVDGLPPGRYYAWQHLYNTTGPVDSGVALPYSDACRKHAWGGVPVVLEAGRTAALKGSSTTPAAAVDLHIMDAVGKPVSHATVFVRDAYLESMGLTNDECAPRPPIVPVVNGIAKVPDVRAGRLEFELLLDTGRDYSVVGEVAPGRPLKIRLPKEAR